MDEEKVAVYIRKSLFEKARKYLEEMGGFKDVGEFIEFLIEEAVEASFEESPGMTREDEEKITERLKDLGYM
ncbi:MAG: CopG family transcriptional regulator [Desulfurococcales archaeon]|nr:CopG family transcriptional regulator [Desulfurococcales archaeon]